MADDASRMFQLSDTALLSHFNSFYPQHLPWRFSHLRPEMLSALITALQCKRSEPALFLREHNPETPNGFDGKHIASPWTLIPRSNTTLIPSPTSKSLPNATAPAPCPPVVNLSGLAQWKRPSAPLARRFPAWGPLTLG
jgi:hypothetical protein